MQSQCCKIGRFSLKTLSVCTPRKVVRCNIVSAPCPCCLYILWPTQVKEGRTEDNNSVTHVLVDQTTVYLPLPKLFYMVAEHGFLHGEWSWSREMEFENKLFSFAEPLIGWFPSSIDAAQRERAFDRPVAVLITNCSLSRMEVPTSSRYHFVPRSCSNPWDRGSIPLAAIYF